MIFLKSSFARLAFDVRPMKAVGQAGLRLSIARTRVSDACCDAPHGFPAAVRLFLPLLSPSASASDVMHTAAVSGCSVRLTDLRHTTHTHTTGITVPTTPDSATMFNDLQFFMIIRFFPFVIRSLASSRRSLVLLFLSRFSLSLSLIQTPSLLQSTDPASVSFDPTNSIPTLSHRERGRATVNKQ